MEDLIIAFITVVVFLWVISLIVFETSLWGEKKQDRMLREKIVSELGYIHQNTSEIREKACNILYKLQYEEKKAANRVPMYEPGCPPVKPIATMEPLSADEAKAISAMMEAADAIVRDAIGPQKDHQEVKRLLCTYMEKSQGMKYVCVPKSIIKEVLEW